VNNLALFMESETFLAQYLGGRFQQGGSAESVARLKEITVDPKTVVLAKAVDANAVGVPKPAGDLQAGTYNYQVTIEMGGQKISMKVSTAITDGGSSWTAVDTMDTPQGSATDTASIAKSTLLLQKRSLKQGTVDIELAYAGDKATGTMSMNGQEKPIAADLGGPVFADAAGADQVIATLPLAVGYATTFRNFDVQTQKVKLQQLNVPATENVTVPAGSFDAFRVEITSPDGSADKKTLWVAKDSHKVVKVSAVIAAMGGAVMTEELTE
jgi:hypothetical protein